VRYGDCSDGPRDDTGRCASLRLEQKVPTSEVRIVVVKTGGRGRGVAQGAELGQFVPKEGLTVLVGSIREYGRIVV
jgi:hypothetical protein